MCNLLYLGLLIWTIFHVRLVSPDYVSGYLTTSGTNLPSSQGDCTFIQLITLYIGGSPTSLTGSSYAISASIQPMTGSSPSYSQTSFYVFGCNLLNTHLIVVTLQLNNYGGTVKASPIAAKYKTFSCSTITPTVSDAHYTYSTGNTLAIVTSDSGDGVGLYDFTYEVRSSPPTIAPTYFPTGQPSSLPSCQPSRQPSRQPTSQPSRQPSGQPTRQPTSQPTSQPSRQPTSQPTGQPSTQPSSQPSKQPSSQPTRQPTCQPTSQPSRQPSSQPTSQPLSSPTGQPSQQPTTQPSAQPTRQPTSQPSSQPTRQPTSQPTCQPSSQPSIQPSRRPTTQPSSEPSTQPSFQPSRQPSNQPTKQPTSQPSAQPSRQPTFQPSHQPSSQPTSQPSSQPSFQPSSRPSRQPTSQPSSQPSMQPSSQPSRLPSSRPSSHPSSQPSTQPTRQPTTQPSMQPTSQPTGQPTRQPSAQPYSKPSSKPSRQPTAQPSNKPTGQPAGQPSLQPSRLPSGQPSSQPTRQPTSQPSSQPTKVPSCQPSSQPSRQPSFRPTAQPTVQPSMQPTRQPSRQPTTQPSTQPTTQPTFQPTCQPSSQPSLQPICKPTTQPSTQPSKQPTGQPSLQPSRLPSVQPSSQPTAQPSRQPSALPSSQPSIQPSQTPTCQPTRQPYSRPSSQPSTQPSFQPTAQPTRQPSTQPFTQPTAQPSLQPTRQPSSQPSARPSTSPSSQPTEQPTQQPTTTPSTQPTQQPSFQPSTQPSVHPSSQPTMQPSCKPSWQPSSQPTFHPTMQPSSQPTLQPSSQPSAQPTLMPSTQPSNNPTSQPTIQPTMQPTRYPSSQPSIQPTRQPLCQPTMQPSMQPSSQPSQQPTIQPSNQPSSQPSHQPSCQPTIQPTAQPSAGPSIQPSRQPISQPTCQPSSQPTCGPSSQPSSQPLMRPSAIPTTQPICQPSTQPSSQPSSQPTNQPSLQPTSQPSQQPTMRPTNQPSGVPTVQPSLQPSNQPTDQPSYQPNVVPSTSPTNQPSSQPSIRPTSHPSNQPSAQPTYQPSSQPSDEPTSQPTLQPSVQPTMQPTIQPSTQPSLQPSNQPTRPPSNQPSAEPTSQPNKQPSSQPTREPTWQPTSQPSHQPSSKPTNQPSTTPSSCPSRQPSRQPSNEPSSQPSVQPTGKPTSQPVLRPTSLPSVQPTRQPITQPTLQPSIQPTLQPATHPTSQPNVQPSSKPTYQPTGQPSRQPTLQPFGQPSSQPSSQTRGFKIWSNALYVESALSKNDLSLIEVKFSRDTNAIFGPGWFLCRKIVDFHGVTNWVNSYGIPNNWTFIDKSSLCNWRSTSLLHIVNSKSFIRKMRIHLSNHQQMNALLDIPFALVNNSGLTPLYGDCPVLFNHTVPLQFHYSEVETKHFAAESVRVLPESNLLMMDIFAVLQCAEWKRSRLYVSLTVVKVNKHNEVLNVMPNISISLSSSITNQLNLAASCSQNIVYQDIRSYMGKNYSISDFNVTICSLIGICKSFVLKTPILLPSSSLNNRNIIHVFAYVISPYNQNVYWVDNQLSLYSSSGVQTVNPINGTITSTRISMLSYAWNITCFANNTIVIPFAVMKYKLRGVVWSSPRFSLPANRLEPEWVCDISLTVMDTISGIYSAIQKSSFQTKYKVSSFQLTPSQSTFMLSNQDSFTINANTNIYRLSNITLSSPRRQLATSPNFTNVKYIWSCDTQYRGNVTSSDIAMLASSLSATPHNSGISHCGLSMTPLTNTSSRVNILPKDNWNAWNSYSISVVRVTLMKGNAINDQSTEQWYDIESKSFVVVIKPQSVPWINIVTPVNALHRVSSTRGVTIEAKITAPVQESNDNTLFVGIASWSLLTSNAQSFANGIMNTSIPVTLVRPRISDAMSVPWQNTSKTLTLQLLPWVLQDGGYYVFRLTCGTSFADVIVTSNQSPYAGSLVVTPDTGGAALSTEFLLSAPGWTDDVEDLPLLYTFAYNIPINASSSLSIWQGIPTYRRYPVINTLLLPPGWSNTLPYVHQLMLRCQVNDTLGASGQEYASLTVTPSFSSKSAATSILSLASAMIVSDELSAMRTQQLVSAVVALLRSNTTFISLQDRVTVLSQLVQSTNHTLPFSQPENLDVATQLWNTLLMDLKTAIYTMNQAQALQTLSIISKQTNSSLIDQTTKTVSSLMDLLLQQDTNNIQLVTDLVKVTITKVIGNVTISIPDSISTVSIGVAGSSEGAIVSVVQYDTSLWKLNSNSSSSTSVSTPPILASNVVTIKITFTTNTSQAVIPSFTANLSVSSVSTEAPLFEHNCTMGVEEHVSFLCPESYIWFNLTCSGKASAVMRRRCPVAQRVCSVLSVSTGGVSSDSSDFCQTVVSGLSVRCKCGFGNSTKGISENGAVSVAVTTQYVPGNNFGGAVAISGSALSGNLAQASSAVFTVFGLLWGFGLIAISFHFFSVADYLQEQKKKVLTGWTKTDTLSSSGATCLPPVIFPLNNSQQLQKVNIVTPLFISKMPTAEITDTLVQEWKTYLLACLPPVFQPASFFLRIWRQLQKEHKFVHVLYALLFPKRFSQTPKQQPAAMHRHHKASKSKEEENVKKEISEIVFILTTVTVSCFILALLYDLQYPSDDGSCESFTNKQDCTTRTSFLDTEMSYCNWQSLDEHSAGFIVESQYNNILQTLRLEDVLEQTYMAQCTFNTDNSSMTASVLSIVITSVISAPVAMLLKFLINILRAPSQDETIENMQWEVRRKQWARRVQSSLFGTTPTVHTSDSGINDKKINDNNDGINLHWNKNAMHTLLERFKTCYAQVPAQYNMDIPEDAKIARDSIIMHQLHHLSTERSTTLVQDNINQNTLSKAMQEQLHKSLLKLANVSEDVYGHVLIEEMYKDILGRSSAVCKLFEFALAKEKEAESAMSPVSRYVHYLAVFCLVAMNLGALYYVALKGMSRGLAWQITFLKVCLLELSTEITITQTFEVIWLDFLLPNLIYKEVQQAVHILHQMSVRMNHVYHKKVRNADVSPPKLYDTTVSQILAQQKVHILESHLARFLPKKLTQFDNHSNHKDNNKYYNNTHRICSTSIDIKSATMSYNNTENNDIEDNIDGYHDQNNHWMKRLPPLRRMVILIIVRFPGSVHSIGAYFLATAIVAAMILIWYAMQQIHYGTLYFLSMVGGVLGMAGLIYVLLIRNKSFPQAPRHKKPRIRPLTKTHERNNKNTEKAKNRPRLWDNVDSLEYESGLSSSSEEKEKDPLLEDNSWFSSSLSASSSQKQFSPAPSLNNANDKNNNNNNIINDDKKMEESSEIDSSSTLSSNNIGDLSDDSLHPLHMKTKDTIIVENEKDLFQLSLNEESKILSMISEEEEDISLSVFSVSVTRPPVSLSQDKHGHNFNKNKNIDINNVDKSSIIIIDKQHDSDMELSSSSSVLSLCGSVKSGCRSRSRSVLSLSSAGSSSASNLILFDLDGPIISTNDNINNNNHLHNNPKTQIYKLVPEIPEFKNEHKQLSGSYVFSESDETWSLASSSLVENKAENKVEEEKKTVDVRDASCTVPSARPIRLCDTP